MIERAVLVENNDEMLDRRLGVDVVRMMIVAVIALVVVLSCGAAHHRSGSNQTDSDRRKNLAFTVVPLLFLRIYDVDLRQVIHRR
ncbi:hypothetical protein [Bradyrhizobium elkanii]|uniref:hypothetical protein n=1 Tax=Bradyrhizobium elkanii TaxID=29448 RepID=UPI00271556E6|nr:hypothetical protein [Bradyrhizobium elkanii]WLC12532.1 hypothetical protein QIH86_20395 [Bradyrhizobium elkanii USDA 94]